MKPARALQPLDRIAHYEIVSPLATGGMGEVYLAKDEALERNVALKVLPLELTRNEERVRRFVREAKSASSLNHPNIVTIYEIGEDEVKPADESRSGDPSTSVHYISMELVSGDTLTTKIHHEKVDLRALLGYLAQAAEGLAKAHAAGIVHRDLKPGNIMVSKDGFAKVLDFGLAKLTERKSSDPEASAGATQTEEGTRVGAVMGTVGYMSPEQVQAKTVDHRSDIFSFGCILYEAATRRKPFAADSDIETMHQILNEKPTAIEELNPNVPAELRRLIRRCLAKNPDQRLQSVKDLAIELREIVDEYDSLSPSGSSGSSAAPVIPVPVKRPGRRATVIAAAAVIVVGGIAGGFWIVRRGGPPAPEAPSALEITPVMSGGRGRGVSQSISPDGRYLAYVKNVDGIGSIRVSQLATGSDVEVLSGQKVIPTDLVFSPDGNYLYYLSNDPDHFGFQALFEIPSLGGSPRKRTYDIDSRASFSPDGKRFCFLRGVPNKEENQIVIADLASGRESVFIRVKYPEYVLYPKWSPDGARIASVRGSQGADASRDVRIEVARVDNGRSQPVGDGAWLGISDLAWLPDGRSLVLSALDPHTLNDSQLWLVSYPSGRPRRITTGVDSYWDVSVGSDGALLSAMRSSVRSNLWRAETSGSLRVSQLTFRTAEGSPGAPAPATDGSIYYAAVQGRGSGIFAIARDGSNERLVSRQGEIASAPIYRPGAGLFYQVLGPNNANEIWRSDENGESPRRLTSRADGFLRGVSGDGGRILYWSEAKLWVGPVEGGTPVPLGRSGGMATISPDGSRVFLMRFAEEKGRTIALPTILSADSGDVLQRPAVPQRAAGLAWTPDCKALTYCDPSNEQRNLFRAELDGGSPIEITHFTDGRILGHRWSPDGKGLALVRQIGPERNIWIANADGTDARAITDFETGSIMTLEWTWDSKAVVFGQGDISQTPVLIRNFR